MQKVQVQRILRRACEQRLLPTLINTMSLTKTNQKLYHDFKKAIQAKYTDSLRIPQIYEKGEEKTDRQKFKQKIERLKRNQTPIQYIEMKKDDRGRYYPTYKGHNLDQIQIQTVDDYKIFKDFNQENFHKHALDNIFNDKLELDQITKIKKQKQRKNQNKLRVNTVQSDHPRQKLSTVISQSPRLRVKRTTTVVNTLSPNKFPILTKNISLQAQKPTRAIEVRQIGRIISGQQIMEIQKIFNRIGGYKDNSEENKITKQSFTKYLKIFYQRPYRIVQFFQLNDVMTRVEYIQFAKRIKMMHKLHFNFLAFLFYDKNNDAIICEKDLANLNNLAEKYPIFKQDHKKLIRVKKRLLQTVPRQSELYNLKEITETIFFEWSKYQQVENIFEEYTEERQAELQSIDLRLKSKKNRIDFKKFNQIYKYEKPMLWYDLLYRIAGTRYQGIWYNE